MEKKHVRLSDLQRELRGGIRCPRCNCADWRVRRTEPRNGFIQRKRICRNCGRELSTREY